jgi:hypothetical protein
MEVQHLHKKKAEKMADWLLDATLLICKVDLQKELDHARKPAKKWDASLEAEQVHYYCKDNKNTKKHCDHNTITYVQNSEDSDSSMLI